MRRWLVLTLLLCSLPARAVAMERDPDDSGVAGVPHFDDRRWQTEVRFGAGTTVGLLGLVGEVNLLDRVALGAGVGFNEFGAAFGAHVRLRPLVFRGRRSLHAVTVELAYSHTRYAGQASIVPLCDSLSADPQSSCSARFVPMPAHWGQLEFGWEARLPSGLTLRVATGGAWLLHRIDWQCEVENTEARCPDDPSGSIPVTALGVGYAF